MLRTPYARTLSLLSVAASFTLGTIAGTLTTIAASPAPSYSLVTVMPVIECDTDADCEAKNPSIEQGLAAVPDVEQRMARGIKTFRF